MRNEVAEDDGALGMADMLASTLRVACMLDTALGRPARQADEMDEMEQDAYQAALAAVVTYAEQNEDKEMDLTVVAATGNAAWQTRVGKDPIVPFEQIDARIREKWRYLIKHIWNLLAYDGGEDGSVLKHEENIEAIFRAKLEENNAATV